MRLAQNLVMARDSLDSAFERCHTQSPFVVHRDAAFAVDTDKFSMIDGR
jgi:hypothetical protein